MINFIVYSADCVGNSGNCLYLNKNVVTDSAGRTGVVLLCCGISIRKSEEKGIEGKLSRN